MAKYSIGLDFGTLSVRALLVNTANGEECASSEYIYPHGVISDTLPSGKELPLNWALQDPQDYLDGISFTVRNIVTSSGVSPDDVIGIGLDFTSSTFLPVDENFTPLCFREEFRKNPHAWVKLWKHHATQEYAKRMTEQAVSGNEDFLKYYNRKISAEWMLPRMLETLEEAPEVYDSAYRFIEGGDWIVACLTGHECRSMNIAGFKALWSKEFGYPSKDFLGSLNPRFSSVAEEKLSGNIQPLGFPAGNLSSYGAELTGLPTTTAVSTACIDAQAALPLIRDPGAGKMIMCIGTSTGHIMTTDKFRPVPGITGSVENGILPGMFAYESGQICVGDSLNWFVDHCVPEEYTASAKKEGINIHGFLTRLAGTMAPGESGLLALDWWNGNRSVLCDYDLSGMIVGLTLQTKPEEIYRALIESTAFGTRKIIESYLESGIEINTLYACGGIARKNELFMQIYADVLGREIHIISSDQAPAHGSAIFGAVAAGKESGGYSDIFSASSSMGVPCSKTFSPIPEYSEIYDELYSEYLKLHDYFGRGENDLMRKLKSLRKSSDRAEKKENQPTA
ncbi:MAG: ribulokinase [Eubacteriales bacterium]|nr:ribulokinase [Eubacteriales bacterium]